MNPPTQEADTKGSTDFPGHYGWVVQWTADGNISVKCHEGQEEEFCGTKRGRCRTVGYSHMKGDGVMG